MECSGVVWCSVGVMLVLMLVLVVVLILVLVLVLALVLAKWCVVMQCSVV